MVYEGVSLLQGRLYYPTKHVSGREVEDRWEADRRQEEYERRTAPPLSQTAGTKEHEPDLNF